eukprot:4888200-Lingulodinium_polyedra.AAC.1
MVAPVGWSSSPTSAVGAAARRRPAARSRSTPPSGSSCAPSSRRSGAWSGRSPLRLQSRNEAALR